MLKKNTTYIFINFLNTLYLNVHFNNMLYFFMIFYHSNDFIGSAEQRPPHSGFFNDTKIERK